MPKYAKFPNLSGEDRQKLLKALEEDFVPPTEEQVYQWLQEEEERLQFCLDNDLPEEENPMDEMLDRKFQAEAAMRDPMLAPIQKRLNEIGYALKGFREQKGELSARDVAKMIGIKANTMLYIEEGWTDPTELAGIIEAWGNALGLDGKVLKEAIPGQETGHGIH